MKKISIIQQQKKPINIKVCGITSIEQIEQMDKLHIDFIGLDFDTNATQNILGKQILNCVEKQNHNAHTCECCRAADQFVVATAPPVSPKCTIVSSSAAPHASQTRPV